MCDTAVKTLHTLPGLLGLSEALHGGASAPTIPEAPLDAIAAVAYETHRDDMEASCDQYSKDRAGNAYNVVRSEDHDSKDAQRCKNSCGGNELGRAFVGRIGHVTRLVRAT